ncbi:MAG: replication initiator protein [Microviridae sp.]|nr:MAG: replication initiator protein [Microviridae sp.]AXQ65573.1 MAG: replication initiator protein [Microviridae sp.]
MLSPLQNYIERNKPLINPSPSIKCEKPLRVWNKYLQQYVIVACRKCNACLYLRGVNLTQRAKAMVSNYAYNLFFTLTYDNEHIPMMYLANTYGKPLYVGNKPIGFNRLTGNYIYPTVEDPDCYDTYNLLPRHMESDKPCFAYVNKRDVQLFMMRIRTALLRGRDYVDGDFVINDEIKNLSKNEKKFKYFLCSEYGPTTFRPHYHGIFSTNSQRVAEFLARNVSALWSMCDASRVDVQYVSGSACAYVAKYVNGITHLPKILRGKFTAPFYLSSKNCHFNFDDDLYKTLGDIIVNGHVESLEYNEQEQNITYVPYTHTYYTRYFPTCKGFGLSSVDYQLRVFEKYLNKNYVVHKYLDKDGIKKVDSHLNTINTACPADYLSKDDFIYQDYRFARMVSFWCSFDIPYPIFVDGVFTGKYDLIRLTPRSYLVLLNKLYDNIKLYALRKFYLNQSAVLSDVHNMTHYCWYLLLDYPEECFDLFNRRFMTLEEFNDYVKLRPFLQSLKCVHGDFYDPNGRMLRLFIDFVRCSPLMASYKCSIRDKFLKDSKKKYYNELFTNLHY